MQAAHLQSMQVINVQFDHLMGVWCRTLGKIQYHKTSVGGLSTIRKPEMSEIHRYRSQEVPGEDTSPNTLDTSSPPTESSTRLSLYHHANCVMYALDNFGKQHDTTESCTFRKVHSQFCIVCEICVQQCTKDTTSNFCYSLKKSNFS
ncbi:hypothetical protein CBL_06888 [Carabus blaptoides fortunei]